MGGAVPPADEEGDPRDLRLLDLEGLPFQERAVRPCPRAGHDPGQAEPGALESPARGVDVADEDRPSIWTQVRALAQLRDAPGVGRPGLGGEDLDIESRPEGHERIARAAAGVLAADLGPHARALLEAANPFVQVTRAEDQVIDVGLGRGW